MIKRITANQGSFRTVEFTQGFNVIWADRTKESTKKDSRNGLGKSTLIEIIHFCMGANVDKKALPREHLPEWEFSLELAVGSRQLTGGIDNMKIFCYDLMLARLWAEQSVAPRILVHDSIIFDGVDERQRARALELAAQESATHGFQYICTLNSDMAPEKELSSDFDLSKYIRLRLTDENVKGSLLGVRF